MTKSKFEVGDRVSTPFGKGYVKAILASVPPGEGGSGYTKIMVTVGPYSDDMTFAWWELKRLVKKKKRYVIVRSYAAGAAAGYLKKQSKDGKRVTLSNSRRLWYWKGAASLHELANKGVTCPNECKFPAELIGDHEIVGVCEILSVTEVARKNIAAVPVWSAHG